MARPTGAVADAALTAAAAHREAQEREEQARRQGAVGRAKALLRGPFGFPPQAVSALTGTVDSAGTVTLTDGTVRIQVGTTGVVYLVSPLPPGLPAGGVRVNSLAEIGLLLEKVV